MAGGITEESTATSENGGSVTGADDEAGASVSSESLKSLTRSSVAGRIGGKDASDEVESSSDDSSPSEASGERRRRSNGREMDWLGADGGGSGGGRGRAQVQPECNCGPMENPANLHHR